MKTMSIHQLTSLLQADCIQCEDVTRNVNLIASDSRKPMQDAVFIALVGEQFDAHDFCQQAVEHGAIALIVERQLDLPAAQIIVPDTLQALATIGRYQRQAYALPTVALTGSCGKTTTKEMITSILSQTASVHATRGNLNNQFGVPFTLLELQPQHQYSVIEMGAGEPGDINYLTSIALPDVALITCIAEAHLERMGSLEGIARTKGEILNGLSDSGTAVLPLDERWLAGWSEQLKDGQQLLTFGLTPRADVYATDLADIDGGIRFTLHQGEQSAEVDLPLLGLHNVQNATAATAVALVLGLSLQECVSGLAKVGQTAGRLNVMAGKNGSQLIDDTYNANPEAMLAAARVLASFPGEHIMIAGDMAELGEHSPEIHFSTGERLKDCQIDQLLTVGRLSAHLSEAFGENGLHFNNKRALVDYVLPQLGPDKVLLVKGSRSAGMEEVVQQLTAMNDPDANQQEVAVC